MIDLIVQKLKEAKNAGVQLAEVYGEFSTQKGIFFFNSYINHDLTSSIQTFLF